MGLVQMIITDPILKALKKAVEAAGNPSQFARYIPGLKQTTVRNWLLGITKSISDDNWQKIEPILAPYLQWSPNAIEYCIEMTQKAKEKKILIDKNTAERVKKDKDYDSFKDPQWLKMIGEYSEAKMIVTNHLEFYIDQLDIDLLEKILLLIKDTPESKRGIYLHPTVADLPWAPRRAADPPETTPPRC